MSERSSAVAVATVCACIVSAAGVLWARETMSPLPVPSSRILYLQSGSAASRLFLSFDALAADVYWMRAIQHYGRDRISARSDRFSRLYPLLDLTTTLDPHFSVAYRFGAIFLAMDPPDGPGRPDLAIALLEKGLAKDPGRWQYAHDVGFVHYWHTGRFREAAEWFLRAAEKPGAPDWIGPLAAATLAGGGDREGARRLLAELRDSGEPHIRQTAELRLAQLAALDDLDRLQSAVDAFRERTGRYPAGWADLRTAGLLRGTPTDPAGAPYLYQPDTHTVALAPDSALLPLPRVFGR